MCRSNLRHLIFMPLLWMTVAYCSNISSFTLEGHWDGCRTFVGHHWSILDFSRPDSMHTWWSECFGDGNRYDSWCTKRQIHRMEVSHTIIFFWMCWIYPPHPEIITKWISLGCDSLLTKHVINHPGNDNCMNPGAQIQSHKIRVVWYIYPHANHKNQANVGIPYMDA